MTNHSQKGVVKITWSISKFCGPNDISGTAKARVVTFCTQVDYIKSELSVDKAPLKETWPGSHDDPFSTSTLVIISPKLLKRESLFLYTGRTIYQMLALG